MMGKRYIGGKKRVIQEEFYIKCLQCGKISRCNRSCGLSFTKDEQRGVNLMDTHCTCRDCYAGNEGCWKGA